MTNFFKWEILKNKRNKGIFYTLILLFVYTIIIAYGVKLMANEYSQAGMMLDNEVVNELYFFFGYTPTGRSASSLSIAAENLMVDFIIPVLIGGYFVDKFLGDRKHKRHITEMVRIGESKYYIRSIICMTISVLGVFWTLFTLQALFGYIVDYVMRPRNVQTILGFNGLIDILTSGFRIALFYALTAGVALCISAIFPVIGRIVYIIPIFIVILTEVLIKPTQPLKEAFITSGNAIEFKSIYFYSIGLMFLIMVLATIILYLMRRDVI